LLVDLKQFFHLPLVEHDKKNFMDSSPKRLRTNVNVDLVKDGRAYMGTPESKTQKRSIDAFGNDPDSPGRVEPTPIRMGIVRKSLANFARSVVPPSAGKSAPPALPTIGYLAKSKAPGLPPVPKKVPPMPNQASRASAESAALPQLRPLFWHTFPPPTDRTCVWDDVDVSVTGTSDLVRQAEARLVSLFAYNQKQPASGIRSENIPPRHQQAPASQQPAIIMHGKRLMKVLDDRKTQNLAIAFRKFPEPEAVMEAIVSVDISKLTGEQVSLLLQEFPSPDMCAAIEQVESSHPEEEDYMFEWDRPEQYLLVLACIHNCKHILTVWSFAVNHHNRIEGDCGDGVSVLLPTTGASGGSNVRQQLTDFISACDAICNSTSLRSFLAVLREVGNRMNINTSRGNARGVGLESVLQFDDLKSSGQASVSLLHVVVEIWAAKNSDNTSDLLNQMKQIRKLRIPSIQEMEIDINKQNEFAKRATDSLRLYYQELEDESSMVIADKLKGLSDPVLKQIKGNLDLLAKARASWTKCLGYFCVKGDSLLSKNSNDFFDHWKKTVKLIEKYAAGGGGVSK